MANALVGWPRWTQQATFSSPAAFDANYPVTNAGTTELWRVARTDTTEDLLIVVTFPEERLIQLCVLGRHNINGSNATVRWRLYDAETGGTLLHDSGSLPIWAETKTEDQVTWDSGDFWDRGYTDEEKEGYPFYAPYYVPDMLYVRRVEVTIDAPGQPGPVDIGIIELASAYEFPVNIGVGAQEGRLDRSIIQEADGGSEYFEERTDARVFQGEVPALDLSDAKAGFAEFKRQTKTTRPFFFWLDRDDVLNTLRDAFLARNLSIELSTYLTSDLQSVPVNFKEWL